MKELERKKEEHAFALTLSEDMKKIRKDAAMSSLKNAAKGLGMANLLKRAASAAAVEKEKLRTQML